MNNPEIIKPAEGKLGILIVGNGAVATTFITGVLMARKGLAKPIGSMTQYDKVRVASPKASPSPSPTGEGRNDICTMVRLCH